MAERRVGAHQQAAAIGQRRERRRAPRQNRQAVFLELQLADDLRQEQADDVRRGRHFVAGPQLLGRRAAAQHVPPLEHAHLLPGLGQIRGAHQPVVPAADDDRVEFRTCCRASCASTRCRRLYSQHLRRGQPIEFAGAGVRRSSSKSIAATAPLAKRTVAPPSPISAAARSSTSGLWPTQQTSLPPCSLVHSISASRSEPGSSAASSSIVGLPDNMFGDDVGRLAAASVGARGDLPGLETAVGERLHHFRCIAQCPPASARAVNHPASADPRVHRPRRVVRCRQTWIYHSPMQVNHRDTESTEKSNRTEGRQ